jgi:hypothetical protein
VSRPELALAAALLLSGLVNAAPALGLLGGSTLQSLYGLPFEDASLRILMRHRALLFGLLGGGMIAAALALPAWRVPAAAVGLISMLGFALVVWLEGGGNSAIRQLLVVDLAASALLLATLLGWVWPRPQ